MRALKARNVSSASTYEPLFRPFRARRDSFVIDPGAMPLAIPFHAFSVKTGALVDARATAPRCH